MSESPEDADEGQVRALLRELSQQLLAWSREGAAGYEEIVERVGRTYGYEGTTVVMNAQVATIKLAQDGPVAFVKCGIPGFPPLARTQDLEDLLADIYAGKLSATEPREMLKKLEEKEPPHSPFLVWLGVVIISVSFAVDIVGTWEGMLWGGATAMATGLVFLAADRVPEFDKIAQLTATRGRVRLGPLTDTRTVIAFPTLRRRGPRYGARFACGVSNRTAARAGTEPPKLRG